VLDRRSLLAACHNRHMARRAILALGVCAALLAGLAPGASGRLPPLKNGCKLVTDLEIKELMGRKPVAKRGYPEGCVWTTRRMVPGDVEQGGRNAEQASVTTTNYNSVMQAQELFDFLANPDGPCRPLLHLPPRQIGDESGLGCSNIFFRLGKWVVEVATHTNDVEEESSADIRRTTKLARKAAKRIRRYRCGAAPPTCPR
jgi:hypothetical protein